MYALPRSWWAYALTTYKIAFPFINIHMVQVVEIIKKGNKWPDDLTYNNGLCLGKTCFSPDRFDFPYTIDVVFNVCALLQMVDTPSVVSGFDCVNIHLLVHRQTTYATPQSPQGDIGVSHTLCVDVIRYVVPPDALSIAAKSTLRINRPYH